MVIGPVVPRDLYLMHGIAGVFGAGGSEKALIGHAVLLIFIAMIYPPTCIPHVWYEFYCFGCVGSTCSKMNNTKIRRNFVREVLQPAQPVPPVLILILLRSHKYYLHRGLQLL